MGTIIGVGNGVGFSAQGGPELAWPATLGDDLVTWYDSTLSAAWVDQSGNGNNASITGATNSATGWNGTKPGLHILGQTGAGGGDRVLSAAGTPNLNTFINGDDVPWSVVFAASIDGTISGERYWGSWGAAGTPFTIFGMNGAAQKVYRKDDAAGNTTYTGSVAFATGRHVFAYTFDGSTIRLYVDAVSYGSVASARGAMTLSQFTFGRAWYGGSYDVGIDFVCPSLVVASVALDAGDITAAQSYYSALLGGL
jgi:hypothetical protein